MYRHYPFFPVLICCIAGLSWWGRTTQSYLGQTEGGGWGDTPFQVEAGQAGAADSFLRDELEPELPAPELDERRAELLGVLDRVVLQQHLYRAKSGHFTQILSRLSYTIPERVSQNYEIRISAVASDRFVLMALSERRGKVVDVVSVDQDYHVRANFTLPEPGRKYLQAQAELHLQRIQNAIHPEKLEEFGIFRGYFKYSVRSDSRDRKIAIAEGIRAPVLGLQVQLSSADAEMSIGEAASMGAVIEARNARVWQGFGPEILDVEPEEASVNRVPANDLIVEPILSTEQ